MSLNQCVVLPIFHRAAGMPLDAFCGEIAAIGYKAVEFFSPGEQLLEIAAAAAKHGLTLASMSGHASLTDGLNKIENHERIVAELRKSIDVAAEYGIGGLICFSGNRNPGQSDLEGMIACAQGLRRIAPYAEKKGVNLNIELLNSRVDHPGYLCDRSDWGLALCEMAGSPRIKLLFDIYHMQIMEGDVIRNIRKCIQYIGHFHTAGNPGRHDMDDAQELNYRGICRAIAETGYDLYVGHEFTPKSDPMAALHAAHTLCAV